jgi:hypothetical protein
LLPLQLKLLQLKLLSFASPARSRHLAIRKLGPIQEGIEKHVIRPHGDRRIELLGPHPGGA